MALTRRTGKSVRLDLSPRLISEVQMDARKRGESFEAWIQAAIRLRLWDGQIPVTGQPRPDHRRRRADDQPQPFSDIA